jgi:hypothetical protein
VISLDREVEIQSDRRRPELGFVLSLTRLHGSDSGTAANPIAPTQERAKGCERESWSFRGSTAGRQRTSAIANFGLAPPVERRRGSAANELTHIE